MQGNPTPTPASIGAQPADALLSALVALAGNGILEKTGSGAAAAASIGATGRDLLAASDQATARGAIRAEQEIVIVTNANGTVWRFPRLGLQICFLNTQVADQSINTAYGSLFVGSRTWVFPAVFSSPPTVPSPGCRWGASASWGSVVGASTTTSVSLRFIDATSREVGANFTLSAIAIGTYTP